MKQGTGKAILVVFLYCGLLGSALLQTWAVRHSMQSDGIAYLDMGDAIVRGDWNMATNGYWSPLYPLLLGLTLRIVNPSVYSQFPVVHFVNFAIFAFAFLCFDLFLRALLPADTTDNGRSPPRMPPRLLFFALGYLTFAWLALSMITVERVSPDMLMAAFVFLACRQLLRIRAGRAGILSFFLLGAILGIGYLVKSPMFPLSLVILGTAAFAGGGRQRVRGVLIALLTFLSITGPYIWVVSKSKGRLVISDSGRVNYLFHVNHAAPGWYFQKLGTADGHYIHNARKIHDSPAIYEFANPIKGTQPIWYDTSYWTEGASPRIDLPAWIALIGDNVHVYGGLFWHYQPILIVGFGLLAFGSGIRIWRGILKQWPVLVPALAGLAMYGLVVVEDRYTAVFFILIWAVWLRAIQAAEGRFSGRIRTAIACAAIAALGTALAWSTVREFSDSPIYPAESLAAEALNNLGVHQGAKVARIGGRLEASWARLAGVSVIAEVPEGRATDFWKSAPHDQDEMIQLFRSLGVDAVVAEQVPPTQTFHPGTQWRSLESSDRYYALVF